MSWFRLASNSDKQDTRDVGPHQPSTEGVRLLEQSYSDSCWWDVRQLCGTWISELPTGGLPARSLPREAVSATLLPKVCKRALYCSQPSPVDIRRREVVLVDPVMGDQVVESLQRVVLVDLVEQPVDEDVVKVLPDHASVERLLAPFSKGSRT